MIPPQVILEHGLAEPFRAFRIHTAGGWPFDFEHPEFIQMGRSLLTVFIQPENEGPQRWKKNSLMLIESISPLDVGPVGPGSK